MLVTQKRPRDLHWYHAGPLLFGDWGTSRLYVLGFAFYYAGHASVLYMAAMCLIMAAAVIGLMCIPYLGEGLRTVSLSADHAGSGLQGWTHRWESLVRIVLALSGVEAVANMTGLMKEPVKRTSKRTIWPVLVEVVVLNMIFGLALNAMPGLAPVDRPDYAVYEQGQGLPSDQVPESVQAYRDTAVRL